jgi:hypothetical protein
MDVHESAWIELKWRFRQGFTWSFSALHEELHHGVKGDWTGLEHLLKGA